MILDHDLRRYKDMMLRYQMVHDGWVIRRQFSLEARRRDFHPVWRPLMTNFDLDSIYRLSRLKRRSHPKHYYRITAKDLGYVTDDDGDITSDQPMVIPDSFHVVTEYPPFGERAGRSGL